MLGCVTPALVALLAAIGLSGSLGWLDPVLLAAIGGVCRGDYLCRRVPQTPRERAAVIQG